MCWLRFGYLLEAKEPEIEDEAREEEEEEEEEAELNRKLFGFQEVNFLLSFGQCIIRQFCFFSSAIFPAKCKYDRKIFTLSYTNAYEALNFVSLLPLKYSL